MESTAEVLQVSLDGRHAGPSSTTPAASGFQVRAFT
jgi:hypothetical protein